MKKEKKPDNRWKPNLKAGQRARFNRAKEFREEQDFRTMKKLLDCWEENHGAE